MPANQLQQPIVMTISSVECELTSVGTSNDLQCMSSSRRLVSVVLPVAILLQDTLLGDNDSVTRFVTPESRFYDTKISVLLYVLKIMSSSTESSNQNFKIDSSSG